jgi:hypothetical protein
MIYLNLQDKKIEIEKGKAVITETREIELTNSKDIEELKRKLKNDLGSIVRNVKLMKERAFEIKKILVEIERQEKEKPIKGV